MLLDIIEGPRKGERVDMPTRQAMEAITRGWATQVATDLVEPPAEEEAPAETAEQHADEVFTVEDEEP